MDTTRIAEYIEIGANDRHWYKDTEDLFVKIFGQDKLALVANIFAATSIKSTLSSNIRLFRRALHEIENGLPFSNYLPVMRIQLDHIRAGRPLGGRKIRSFANAMTGDKDAVVVDRWLMRAFGKDGTIAPTNKEYDEIEGWIRDYAKWATIYHPYELSAMIWSGVRQKFTGSRLTRYDEVLKFQMCNMYDA